MANNPINKYYQSISNFQFQISNRHWGISLFVTLICLFAYLLIGSILKANALSMTNANYILQMGNLNSGAGKPSNSSYQLGITLGQTGPGLYSGTNYKVRSGFQYIRSIIYFKFSVSSTYVDLGPLTAGSPATRTQTLTVNNGSAHGYIVTSSESTQLRNPGNGQLIPDTTCDDGTCTATLARPWTSPLTYGFGYNCTAISSPNVCASGFTDGTYYKPFTASPSAQTVMTNANVGKNQQVQITYKVNVSATQPAGLYTNIINYIATPTF